LAGPRGLTAVAALQHHATSGENPIIAPIPAAAAGSQLAIRLYQPAPLQDGGVLLAKVKLECTALDPQRRNRCTEGCAAGQSTGGKVKNAGTGLEPGTPIGHVKTDGPLQHKALAQGVAMQPGCTQGARRAAARLLAGHGLAAGPEIATTG